jgi:Tfp pilus assembly protein PilO
MRIKIHKNYIISAFFVSFFVFFIIFIIYPLIKEIKNNSKDLNLIKEEIISSDQERTNLKNLKPILEKAEPDSKKIDSLFINSKAPIDFIKFLEELAKNCNISMKIDSINPGNAKKYSWQIFTLQLEISGLYSNFSKFVDKLENRQYLIDIYNLSITKLSNLRSGSSTLSSSIVNASIYFTVLGN